MTAVRTEHLAKRFGRRTALSDCTVSIPEGRVVGIVGSNGAGKSTLLRCIAGLEPTMKNIPIISSPTCFLCGNNTTRSRIQTEFPVSVLP